MASEVVLITGASSGIGWEIAERFASDGAELILVARREEKLRELAERLHADHGTKTRTISMDLSTPGAASELHKNVLETHSDIDVLVNNAGFGQYGKFEEIPVDRHVDMCMLNVVTLTELTRLILPRMIERNRGSILNLGSTASFQPGPNCAVYYATKAYVLSFSEALTAELWGTNVSVTCLCPGPTITGFGSDSDMEQATIFQMLKMPVEPVVDAGYRGVRKKRRLVVPGFMNNLLAFSVRFTARPVILWIMKRLQPLPSPSKDS